MKTPKELEEHYMNSNKGKRNYLPFADFIKQIQEDAYNQAIDDATANAKVIEKCEFNEIHKENYFEYVVNKDSILKLKIK